MSNLPAIPSPLRKGRCRLRPKDLEQYLEHLARTGLMYHAAESVGVCPNTVTNYRKAHPEFEARVQDAMGHYRDGICREVHRRGVDGVSEDVYFQGAVVGRRTTYSDRLIELLAKRHIPEFRDHVTADMTLTGGVLVVGGMTKDPAAWAEQFRGTPALPEGTSNGHDVIAEQPGPGHPGTSTQPPGTARGA